MADEQVDKKPPMIFNVALGRGEWIVGKGSLGGKPALFFEPADPPKPSGTDAPNTKPQTLANGAFVITFDNKVSFEVVHDALDGLSELVEKLP